MDKKDTVYINNGLLFRHKKEWNNAIFCNMDGPKDYHVKSDKDKYIMSLVCGV